ncbi:hypothetical protein ACFYKX_15830 [Cytobacillus sp. FJAT-54145]|uniref:Uncharacterized protein n=1 Tax=Cytobacillus spartinae TaxID=3299023 RepID=A0ABW6KEU6_9BACI
MKQIIDLNEQVKKSITNLEKECELVGNKLKHIYFERFKSLEAILSIDLVRVQKGKPVGEEKVFAEEYESYLEVGIEEDEEYFPNAYIPIWKCKQEWFQLVGYISECDSKLIEKKLNSILEDMLTERIDDMEGQMK